MKSNLNRILRLGLALLVFALVAAIGPAPTHAQKPAPPPQPVELTFSSLLPESAALSKSAKEWASELEKRTNGLVKVTKWYFSEALLKGPDTVSGVGKGISELGYVGAGYTPSLLPLTVVTEMPFVTDVPAADGGARTRLYETYRPFKDEWHKNNLEMMFFHALSPTIIVTKKNVREIEDLKGLKLRAFSLLNDVFVRLEATPIAMSAAEVYLSIQRGTLDGATGIPLWFAYSGKLHEVAKFYADPGIGIYACTCVVMNKDRYDKLPDSVKGIIQDLRNEWPAREARSWTEQDKRYYDESKAAGVTLYRFPESERKRLREKVNVDELWAKWLAQLEKPGVPAGEMLKRYRAFAKELEPKIPYENPFK